MKLNDHVYVEGDPDHLGIISSFNNGSAEVRWGVLDGHVVTSTYPVTELRLFEEKVWSPDEIELRRAKEAAQHGAKVTMIAEVPYTSVEGDDGATY